MVDFVSFFCAIAFVAVVSYMLWRHKIQRDIPKIDVQAAIRKWHPAFSALARDKFRTLGRGFVVVSAPSLYIGQLSYQTGEPEGMAFGYFPEDSLGLIVAKKYRFEQLRAVKKLIRTYDPKESFVLIRILPGTPITTTLTDLAEEDVEGEEGERMLREARECFQTSEQKRIAESSGGTLDEVVKKERKGDGERTEKLDGKAMKQD